MASLLFRSEYRGGGDVRARARLGDKCPVVLIRSRFLPGADQLRVYADDAGAGSDLVCDARAGTARAMAGGSECGVRTGGWGETLVVVRRGHPLGAGGRNVAGATAVLAGTPGRGRAHRVNRAGADALQLPAI